jgi:hypothetical protein
LPPDAIPQLSLGTAALVIFAICAGFVLLRGITRMIVGTLILGLSAWAGFSVWQLAPGLSVDWFGKSLPWFTNGLPIVAFLVSWSLAAKIAKTVARPFGNSSPPQKPRSFAGVAFRLLLALVPTSLISLLVAAFVHHSGSVAEVKASSENPSHHVSSPTDELVQKLKHSLDEWLPESWSQALDPAADPDRLALAKLIAAQSKTPRKPAIDPQTGQPIPRAIIVDDPDLQNLAREGKFDTLLRHPLLTKALADPKTQKLLRDLSL